VNYPEAVAWLYSTQGVGIKLGLENIRRLLDLVGVPWAPQESCASGAPGAPHILHIAGTNGKGSVCAMLDTICRSAGLRTGLYTSPHLVTYRERIRLNGAMIPEAVVASGLTHLREATRAWEHPPTFFELTTALALDWFYREGAEVIVLETGLGGRLDSTNALTPAVTVLTPISLDHQQYLGDTLGSIAAEKAGILKPGIPAVSALQPDEAREVIEATAERLGAPLEWVSKPTRFEVALPGSHQKLNAALAIAAIRSASIPVSDEAIAEGLREVVWPGRFQLIERPSGNRLILDGAHNEAAAERLVRTWRETYGTEKATIILGVLGDKDSAALCRNLAPIAAGFIVTPVANPRSCSAEALARTVAEQAPGVPCMTAVSLEDALRMGESRSALITGSLFLIGEALAFLAGRGPEFPSAQ
jgi:dihydrofolate synthase/folylpolyglutamate synthase